MRTPNNTTVDFSKVDLSFPKLPSPTCLYAGNRKVKNVSYAFFNLLHYYIILRIYVCNFNSFLLLNFATIKGPFFDRFNISAGLSKNVKSVFKMKCKWRRIKLYFYHYSSQLRSEQTDRQKFYFVYFFGISQ